METKNKFITIDKCILKALGYSRISTAIKFLRKYPIEFKSGKSCDDTEADYVLERISKKIHKRGCPQKHDLLVRENSLEKWMKHKRLQLKKKAPDNNLLYFIHEDDDVTLFKIGFTTNLKERLCALQTGNARLLVVYKTIQNSSMKKEKEMHDLFASYHVRGEWYNITCDMIDAVCV